MSSLPSDRSFLEQSSSQRAFELGAIRQLDRSILERLRILPILQPYVG
ncbi:Uncharacterised protein [Streptococcus pneumoniae]|nr:Uncharacterised protein [Streptococcus pneumoniae]